MKIGILTHHYVKNFGAYMQAYALLNTVKSLGQNVEIELIDYRVKKHEFLNAIHFFGIKPKRGDTLSGYFGKVQLFFTHSQYEKSLPKSKRVYNAEEINKLQYDLIIVGADEVWNFNDVAYDAIKFGYGLNTHLISYAASSGGSSVKDSIPSEIRKSIINFDSISVRDNKTEELVRNILNSDKKIIRVLDPVFLYDYKLEVKNRIRNIAKKPYILIYDCHISEKQAKELSAYAKSKDLDIVGAGEYRKWYTVHAENITPFEWAFLFKNAEEIITGTFHGTSFSVKYNKKFVAYLTEGNRINKVSSLLEEFELTDRIVFENSPINLINVLQEPIDYRKVNEIISKKVMQSKQYLKENMKQ